MPQAGEHPHSENVENPASAAHPIAAHGNVNIIPEPAAETHMPAPPELCDTAGKVRIVEILQEAEA